MIDPSIERIVYVDTDILFLKSIDALHAHFDQFNDTHAAALTPEHETPWSGWYNRFARHPYYGEMGVFQVYASLLKNLRNCDVVTFMQVSTLA